MARYKVFLNGANFWLNVEGKPTRTGFYTTRLVDAASAAAAEVAAVELLREDPKLAETSNDPSDPPVIYAEDVAEVDPGEDEDPAQAAFVFYVEEPDA